MYSLVYCEDIDEYYIFRSRNVIQEDDGSCVVAFKASVIFSNSSSKTELQAIRSNLLDHLSRAESHDDVSKQELLGSEENEGEEIKTIQNDNQHPTENKTRPSDTCRQQKFTKRKYCYFCKKMVRKLIKHLMKVHTCTKEVKKLNSLSKESPRRRKFVGTILKKSKEKEILRLQSTKFLGGKLGKTIFHDRLILECGAKYNNTSCTLKRQKDLRTLGQILLEMKKHDATITDLFSVVSPQRVHIFDKLRNRILARLGARLLYRYGKFLLNQHLYRNDFVKKKNVEEFLKLIFKELQRKRRKIKKITTSSTRTPSANRKVHVPMTLKPERNKDDLRVHVEKKERTEIGKLCANVPNNEMMENDNNQHYLLRERNSLSQYAIQRIIQDELYDSMLKEPDKKYSKHKCNKKKPVYFCYFCKKKFSSLILHLLRKHGQEEEVLKFSSLPKGSVERKIMVDSIIQTGRTEYNKSMKSEKDILQSKAESSNGEEKLIADYNVDSIQTASNKQGKKVKLKSKNVDEITTSVVTKVVRENSAKDRELKVAKGDVCGISGQDYKFVTTSLKNKDTVLEDDTKSSLWCMLEGHVNCSPDVIK